MGHQPAHQRLEDEEEDDDEEELGGLDLARGQGQVEQPAAGLDGLRLAVEIPVPVDDVDDEAEDDEEPHDRQNAPEESMRREGVPDRLVRGPVVGVRVSLARAVRRGDPGRPEEEGRELDRFVVGADGVGEEAVAPVAAAEDGGPGLADLTVGVGMRRRQGQGLGGGVVSVGLDERDDPGVDRGAVLGRQGLIRSALLPGVSSPACDRPASGASWPRNPCPGRSRGPRRCRGP